MNGLWTRLARLDPRWKPILTTVFAVVGVAAVTISAIRYVYQAPGDYPTFAPPGVAILTGHWVGVFSNPAIQAGPFELIFWGIPALLGLHDVTGWVAFCIATMVVALMAIAAIAARVLRRDAPNWWAPLASGAAALVALSGLLTTGMNAAHPAEFVIPLLWVVAALLARGGRPLAAGLVLGLSCGWELWGVLGAPVLLLAPRIDVRTVIRTGLGVLAGAVLPYLPFVLLGPFRMFDFHWPIFRTSLLTVLFPGMTSFSWPIRLVQGVLSLGAGVAVAALLRRRMDAVWLAPLAACIVRFCFDPIQEPYYPLPAVILTTIGLMLGLARRNLFQAAGCLVLYLILFEFGRLGPVTIVAALAVMTLTAYLVIRSSRTANASASDVIGVAK
jgi:hypothetical protein